MNPDNTTQPTGTTPSPIPPPMTEKNNLSGIIVLIVIVLVLLLGGYFLMQKMGGSSMPADTMLPVAEGGVSDPSMVGGDAVNPQANAVDPNTIQGTSINISDIEKDLDATDLNSLSADLNAM